MQLGCFPWFVAMGPSALGSLCTTKKYVPEPPKFNALRRCSKCRAKVDWALSRFNMINCSQFVEEHLNG